MKKLVLLLFVCSVYASHAQVFTTRNGYIGFFSKTPLEDIKAENRQVASVIDLQKKSMAFTLLVKSFLFPKQLMQQHFNENYAESDQYPKASFSGTYTGDVDVSKDGAYPVSVRGQLTFHGVTKTIDVPATLEVRSGKLLGQSRFQLLPADYNIKIPSLVRDKIAKQIDVVVKTEYNPAK